MITNLLESMAIAVQAAAIAVVYCVVLVEEGFPFIAWVLRGLGRWREAGGWRSWIASPIGGCEKCTAGQVALWASVLIRGGHGIEALMGHFAAAAVAVLCAPYLAHAYRWMSRQI